MLFQTKPEQIEAYQLKEVTFSNMRKGAFMFDDQPDWISDAIAERNIMLSQLAGMEYLCLEWVCDEELIRIKPGDWLARDRDGFYFKLTAHDLADEFDPVEKPKAAKKTAAKKTAAKK